MYTIRHAALRSGVSVALIRAWERRYGLPEPPRTPAGYRLYDDEAVARLRLMRSLVDSGWAPSQAAHAIASGSLPDGADLAAGRDAFERGTSTDLLTGRAAAMPGEALRHAGLPEAPPKASTTGIGLGLVTKFVQAAGSLDDAAIETALDEAFSLGTIEVALREIVLPAVVAIGDAWAAGRVDVAGEHALSRAVMRRLGVLYEAAGRATSQADVVVGLPPGSRHEIGALAFSVVARRSGLRVLYLGADVPAASWVAAVRETRAAAATLGIVTTADVPGALETLDALHAANGATILAVEGRAARLLPAADWLLYLPADLESAVVTLRVSLANNR